jgi:methyl-accepting chemotaxis protein
LPQQKLKNLMTIRAGFVMGSIFVVALMVAGGILGIGGLRMSNAAVDVLYGHMLSPVASLGKINVLLAETRSVLESERLYTDIKKTARNPPSKRFLHDSQLSASLVGNRHEIERLMAQLNTLLRAGGDQKAFEEFQLQYKPFAEYVLIPFEELLNSGLDQDHLDTISARISPLYRGASEASIALGQSLLTSAAHDYQSMRDRNELIWEVALAGILFGITMVLIVGRIFIRGIVKPLDEAIYSFDRIAQGDLTQEVKIYGKGETGQLIRASATMQMHLKVIMDEVSLVTNRMYSYCRFLNQSLQDISGHTEEQHHLVYQAKDAVDMAAREAASVSQEVEGLLAAVEQVKMALCDDASPVSDPLANLETQIAHLATTLRVQAFAADEVARKMHQIASLIVENRQQTLDAYAVSEQVKQAADELKSLVSYFDTHRLQDKSL